MWEFMTLPPELRNRVYGYLHEDRHARLAFQSPVVATEGFQLFNGFMWALTEIAIHDAPDPRPISYSKQIKAEVESMPAFLRLKEKRLKATIKINCEGLGWEGRLVDDLIDSLSQAEVWAMVSPYLPYVDTVTLHLLVRGDQALVHIVRLFVKALQQCRAPITTVKVIIMEPGVETLQSADAHYDWDASNMGDPDDTYAAVPDREGYRFYLPFRIAGMQRRQRAHGYRVQRVLWDNVRFMYRGYSFVRSAKRGLGYRVFHTEAHTYVHKSKILNLWRSVEHHGREQTLDFIDEEEALKAFELSPAEEVIWNNLDEHEKEDIEYLGQTMKGWVEHRISDPMTIYV
jgi:hypothetical protein